MVELDGLEQAIDKAFALIDKLRDDKTKLFLALKYIGEISTDEKVLKIIERTLVDLQ